MNFRPATTTLRRFPVAIRQQQVTGLRVEVVVDSFGPLQLLMFREEWREIPALVPRSGSAGVEPMTAVLAAAAAINLGEPKRARRLLDMVPPGSADGAAVVPDDAGAIAAALGTVADALDRNWYPGGGAAVLADGDLDHLLARRDTPNANDPTAALLVAVASEFVAALPAWRRIVTGGPDERRYALREAGAVLDLVRRAGVAAVIAPVALAIADLRVRAGHPSGGGALLRLAQRTYRAVADPVGLAACALAMGDWAAHPTGRPETLGEELEFHAGVAGPAEPADLRRAQLQWAAAETELERVGAVRGLAAVALRRAAVSAWSGSPREARAGLDAAHSLAAGSRDGALVRLIATHRALAAAQAGEPVDHVVVGDEITGWALTDGSTSYARGLARLCLARARRWRHTEVSAARAAELLAARILDRVGSGSDGATVRAEHADRYGVMNFSRAALVLALSELDEEQRSTDELTWARRVERAASASRHANALRDAAALARVQRHARSLLESRPRGPHHEEVTAMVAALDRIAGDAVAEMALCRAAAARANGDVESGRAGFETALSAARSVQPVLAIAALAGLGRRDEAVVVLRQLIANGLHQEIALPVLLRLHRHREALATIDEILRQGGPQLPAQPWCFPTQRAEALLGTGAHSAALPFAEMAVRELERQIADLDLDVFRTMATDDVAAADVYTCAVRAHAELGRRGSPEHVARAFVLSDRSRAGSMGDLLRRAPSARPPAVAAVRAWQRAGASLARTVEEIADGSGERTPAGIRADLAVAEQDLDAADATLAATAGVTRRRLPATPGLDEIQRRLRPGTVLVQYHAHGDQLIAWAVTRAGARVTIREFPTADLTAAAAAFHRAAAQEEVRRQPLAYLAKPLAPLLEPIVEQLDRCDHVVVVPHGPLSALPFHLLPVDGAALGTVVAVSYLPAASAAPATPAGVRTGVRALVVGDPEYDPGGELPRLPGTGIEALEVARRWATEPLSARRATREAVLSGADGVDLIHLATHGSFRAGSPYSTELALAGTAGLGVPDLVGVGLQADLVVLSACDSGRGRATAAGDLIGLSRALLGAGARELVVSLWPVDDLVACLTMTTFHRHLRDRPDSVSAALAAAQADVRGLTAAQAEHAYAALGGDRHEVSRRRTARDLASSLGGAGPVDPAEPCHWAPFVHIGTS